MEQLTKSENGARPGSWSPDGETLAFEDFRQDSGGCDILQCPGLPSGPPTAARASSVDD